MAGGKRGPKIPEKTRTFVYEAAITYPNVDRVQLAEALKDELSKRNWMTPSQQTTEKMISEARNSTTSEDDPWSVGMSAQHGIPFDAIGDLLKYWKRCVITGKTLTIREAKWIARLAHLPYDSERLLSYANDYAVRERLWEMAKQRDPNAKFETKEVDAQIAFHNNLRAKSALENTGVLPLTEDDDNPFEQFECNGATYIGIRESEIDPLKLLEETFDPVEWIFIGSLFLKNDFVKTCEWITKSSKIKKTPIYIGSPLWDNNNENYNDNDEVYYIWLAAFSKGKKWQGLDFDKMIELANRLWDEVVNETEELKSLEKELHPLDSSVENAMIYCAMQFGWTPSDELLAEAGLNLKEGGKE